jgi:hypothetical protein
MSISMSRWLRRTIYGAGTGALVAATVVIPRFASAEPPPECQIPKPAKCVVIDNNLFAEEDPPGPPGRAEAINSVRVEENGGDLSKCVNLSPGKRRTLFKKDEFVRSVEPKADIEVWVSGFEKKDCQPPPAEKEAEADFISEMVTVPADDSRYVWFNLKWDTAAVVP